LLDQELLRELQEYIEKHSEQPEYGYALYAPTGPAIVTEALDTELENYIKITANQHLISYYSA